MRNRLFVLLNIREAEAWTVGRMLLFSFFQGLGLALLFTVANVLYLSEVDIATLPYVYILTAALMMGLEVLYQKLEHIWSIGKIILAILLVLAGSMVLFGLGLWLEKSAIWMLFLLIVWEKVASLTANSEFGKINAMIFDIRQSKRLFGLLGSAEIPARILGGLTAPLLLDYMPIESLLFLAAGMLSISIVFYQQVAKRHAGQLDMVVARGLSKLSHAQKRGKGARDFVMAFFGSRYVTLLGIFMFGVVTTSTFVEFSFLTQVDSNLEGQQRLAVFLGVFLSIGELATFVVKSFFSGRLLNRFGLQFGLRLLPLGLLGLLLLFYLGELAGNQADLWVITFMMFYTGVSKSGLTDPAFFSLFQPLNQRQRFEGYNAVGIMENLAFGCGGLALLAIHTISQMTDSQPAVIFMTLLTFVLIGTWASSIFIDKEYHGILEKSLQNRTWGGGAVMELKDSSAVDVLRRHLKSQHIGEVLYALDLLLKFGHPSLREELPPLLEHAEAEVRIAALKGIERHRLSGYLEDVRARMVLERNPKVRAAALSAFASIAEDDFVEEMIPLLDHENREVRAGAMIALIRSGGINGVMAAGERLIALVHSDSPSDRHFAAHIVGEVGIRNFYQPLLSLMEDASEDVVKAALDAAGKVRNPRLVKPLIGKLQQPKVFETAGRSLIRLGALSLPQLEEAMRGSVSESDLKQLRRAVYVSGRIGGEQAIGILKHRMEIPVVEVRSQVLESLGGLSFKASHDEALQVERIIGQEIAQAAFVLYGMERLKEAGGGVLLVAALDHELSQAIGRMLLLLSFIYPSETLRRVRENLFIGERERRANAIEMLDVVLPAQLKRALFPLLEDLPNAQRLEQLAQVFPQPALDQQGIVRRLLDTQASPFLNAWTRAVALYTLRGHAEWPVADMAAPMLRHYHPMVQETAAWVLATQQPAAFLALRRQADTSPLQALMDRIHTNLSQEERHQKLFQVEKVLLLKTVSIFQHTSEEVLSEIAAIATEEDVPAKETVFYKGEEGDCMYIIYRGKVRVHDGDHTFAELGERDIFGEFSLLDPEPRSATVTAISDTLLLRLNQETFYDIMADRIEVVKGILRILVRRLRHQNFLLSQYKASSAAPSLPDEA
jgi:HEAT repeat protein